MTIILAIPTMIASFWGMNVNVPFEIKPLCFIIVITIIAAFTGITTYILVRKKVL